MAIGRFSAQLARDEVMVCPVKYRHDSHGLPDQHQSRPLTG